MKGGEHINRINEDCNNTSFTLTVSDNGIGIPENLDIEDFGALGMQLVTSLVDQLDGKLERILFKFNGKGSNKKTFNYFIAQL